MEVNFLHIDNPHHLIQNIADCGEGPLGAAERGNHVEIVELLEAALATSGELQAVCVCGQNFACIRYAIGTNEGCNGTNEICKWNQ